MRILNFQCPKCERHTQIRCHRLTHQTELHCEHCGMVYEANYRIIYDGDQQKARRAKKEEKESRRAERN